MMPTDELSRRHRQTTPEPSKNRGIPGVAASTIIRALRGRIVVLDAVNRIEGAL